MNFNNKTRFFIILSVLLAALLACGIFPSSDEEGVDAEGDVPEIAADEEENVEESAGTSADSDDCIVGKWLVDNDSMQVYMDASMNEEEDVFIIGEVSGDMYIAYGTDGIMSMSSEDFTFAVSLDTGVEGIELNMTIVVVAEGTAHYEADGGTITNTELDYSVEETSMGSMMVFSGEDATIEITINPGLFIVGRENANPDELSTTYECSRDRLTLSGQYLNEILFRRVE